MGIRISEMEEATTFGADDYVPIVTNGTNKKALGQKIKDFIAGFFVAKDDNSRLITSLGQTFTDCNAVMTSGMYSANMGTVSNAPAGTMVSSNGGQLIVTQRASDVRVFQTLFVYVGNGSKTEIYVRAQNNATSFSDWRHITAADGISFDNTGTGMSAENVQAGIEELNTNIKNIPSRLFQSQKQISFTMSKKTWNIGIFFGNVNGHGNFMGYLSVNSNSIEYLRQVGITPTWTASYDSTTGNVTIGYESTAPYSFAYACVIGLI